MLTPHFPGRAAAAPWFKPEIAPAACFKQLQAAWRAGVVVAAALSFFTPAQHAWDGPAPLLRYAMHGARAPLTCPHEIAASAMGATIMHIIKTTHATFKFAIVFSKKMFIVKCDFVLGWVSFLGLFGECNVLGVRVYIEN